MDDYGNDIHEEYQKKSTSSEFAFGITFFFVFLSLGIFLYVKSDKVYAYLAYFVSLLIIVTTLVEAKTFRVANRLWISFGHLLGGVISPLIIGSIFFLVVTPYAYIFRFLSKNKIPMGFSSEDSYWIESEKPTNFGDQF